MNYQYFLFFILMVASLILAARPLIVVLHELGHAVFALIFTREKVTIYLGSYGDPQHSVKLNLGLLTVFCRYNPFTWRAGLCVPSTKINSINKQIVFALGGPLASLIIGTLICFAGLVYDLHGLLKLFLAVFLSSALVDLIINVIPKDTPINLYGGEITYNDGYTIKQLLDHKRLPKQYTEATDLYHQNQFEEAAALLDMLIIQNKHSSIYRLAISTNLRLRKYEKAKELSLALTTIKVKLNSDDLSNAALAYASLELFDEALNLYDKSLLLNQENKYALNNKGCALNQMGKFQEAIPFFDKTIELDNKLFYSYSNRAFSKIKLGRLEEALEDINSSLEVNNKDAYCYQILGMYYFEKGEPAEALHYYEKAKELDESTDEIEELMQEAKRSIEVRAS